MNSVADAAVAGAAKARDDREAAHGIPTASGRAHPDGGEQDRGAEAKPGHLRARQLDAAASRSARFAKRMPISLEGEESLP